MMDLKREHSKAVRDTIRTRTTDRRCRNRTYCSASRSDWSIKDRRSHSRSQPQPRSYTAAPEPESAATEQPGPRSGCRSHCFFGPMGVVDQEIDAATAAYSRSLGRIQLLLWAGCCTRTTEPQSGDVKPQPENVDATSTAPEQITTNDHGQRRSSTVLRCDEQECRATSTGTARA